MSSKLLGCLEYCLYKLFPLRFQTVWLDTSFRIHAIFYGNEFFEGPEVDLVKGHVRDILIDNRKRNVNFWCKKKKIISLTRFTWITLYF